MPDLDCEVWVHVKGGAGLLSLSQSETLASSILDMSRRIRAKRAIRPKTVDLPPLAMRAG